MAHNFLRHYYKTFEFDSVKNDLNLLHLFLQGFRRDWNHWHNQNKLHMRRWISECKWLKVFLTPRSDSSSNDLFVTSKRLHNNHLLLRLCILLLKWLYFNCGIVKALVFDWGIVWAEREFLALIHCFLLLERCLPPIPLVNAGVIDVQGEGHNEQEEVEAGV